MTDPATNPRAAVAALRARPHSRVLIIGGGINGLATFRDLALQGVEVTLVERGDFVSGASAASSHMIHGGVRYLENGEFRLVKESVTERNGLLKIAPHYVKPLPTTMPIFSTVSGILSAPLRFLTHKQGKPKERGAFLIKVGMTLYDAFSRDGGSVPRHVFRGRKKALAARPQLNPDVKYTATYYDASMHDPERLALDVLRDGLDAGPHARAVNYAEVTGFDGGEVIIRDRAANEELRLRADLIINTSGPWTDLTNAALGRSTRFMGGTRGSHIVVDNPALLEATGGHEIFFENNDGRIVLIYPLKGKVMVGTTDLEADPSQPAICTEEEVDYFFDLVHHVFPTIPMDRSQIVYRFSGIRPLPGHGDQAPGFVSRDYRIERGDADGIPTLSLVGGKWTTFRALAEHLSNEALEIIGQTRSFSTLGRAIGGGVGYPTTPGDRSVWIAAHTDGVTRARAEELLERYGTRADALIDHLAETNDTPLVTAPSYAAEEIVFLAREEQVVHLIDVLKRRTSLAFTGQVTDELLAEIAPIVGTALDWDDERVAREIALAADILRTHHGLELGILPRKEDVLSS